MKKIDKLVLKSFVGPFILTFIVVVFILLTQTMLKYFDDFVGKNLGIEVFAELIFYFSIFTTPVALPLAILLSSLMTFGNLGEHFELTAIKSSGVSLLRTLKPIFVVTIILVFLAFLNNNFIVPKANLKAYSLLYDIKKKKPALDIKEGAFYNGLRGLSIKVNKKYTDGQLEDIIIYDHRKGAGNSNIVLADSGRMYTIMGEKYLVLELYDGNMYAISESPGKYRRRVTYNEIEPYRRDEFESSKLVISLADFDFKRTREELFKGSRLMKDLKTLRHDIDSMESRLVDDRYYYFKTIERNSMQHLRNNIFVPAELEVKKTIKDSLRILEYERRELEEYEPDLNDEEQQENSRNIIDKRKGETGRELKVKFTSGNFLKKDTIQQKITKMPSVSKRIEQKIKTDTVLAGIAEIELDSIYIKIDSAFNEKLNQAGVVSQALSQARFLKSTLSAESTKIETQLVQLHKHEIEKHKKYSQAFACLVMFLIGAPLGAIIKRGGLGIPVIISIVFFIVFYVLSMTGEKWARQGVVEAFWGSWGSNFILLPIGLFFLKQARIDARLFDADFYNVVINKIKSRLGEKFKNRPV